MAVHGAHHSSGHQAELGEATMVLCDFLYSTQEVAAGAVIKAWGRIYHHCVSVTECSHYEMVTSSFQSSILSSFLKAAAGGSGVVGVWVVQAVGAPSVAGFQVGHSGFL